MNFQSNINKIDNKNNYDDNQIQSNTVFDNQIGTNKINQIDESKGNNLNLDNAINQNSDITKNDDNIGLELNQS